MIASTIGSGGGTLKTRLFSESLHYADAAGQGTPRYDGKISVREFDRDLTLYGYDCHGRLTSSQTASPLIGVSVTQDFSTEYTYDRNANLTSLTRHGVTDIISGRRSYGIQNGMTFSYSGNRMQSAEITADGVDYEGRTGVPQYSASGAAFLYDSNGNMISDAVRGITQISYSRLNKPETVTFAGGQRQTITYDGFGNKKRTDYSVGPETVIGGDIPADDAYIVSSSRGYAGPHVFTDGKLEYSGFPGGYFDPARGAMYYITDWQGNNIAVVDSKGNTAQRATYYPYGEPTVEPSGQRYLFGGKEREHAAGLNTYDFGARSLTPYGIWPSPDPFAEKYYNISPYSYCGGDPINRVDRDGKWTVLLSRDKKLNRAALRYTHDDKINVFAHGNPQSIHYSKKDIYIATAEQLKDAIQENLYQYGDISEKPLVEIVLHSCNTGLDPANKDKPLAQKLSEEMPNAIITAPNGYLKIDKKGKETVYDEKGNKKQKEEYWRVFFRGKEIPRDCIELARQILLKEEEINILMRRMQSETDDEGEVHKRL